MFKEKMDNFYRVKEKFEEKICQLQSEKEDLEANLAKIRRAYDIAVIDDVDDGNVQTQADLSKILRKAEDLEKQIKDISDRIAHVDELKYVRLKELLPEIKAERDRIYKETEQQIAAQKVDAMEAKARYLIRLKSYKKPAQEYYEVNNQFKLAARLAGTMEYEKERMSLPTLNLFSTYYNTPVAPSESEIGFAYDQGKLPPLARLCELTGKFELLPDSEALKKISEILKEKEAGK